MNPKPSVTHFVESREQAQRAVDKNLARTRGDFLEKSIGGTETLEILRTMRGRVALALNAREIREDPALLDLIRLYHRSGIEVDFWANLGDEEGYWIHAGNIPKARASILEMVNNLERAHVPINRIGLDLEMPYELLKSRFDLGAWFRSSPWSFSQKKSTDQLENFVHELLEDGRYGVDTYEIPLLGDSPTLRRTMGIPKAPRIESPRYRRVGMVYSSVGIPGLSPERFIKRYSVDRGRIPALGIVSATGENPGRNIDFKGLLTDSELNRDVAKALEVSPKELYVFALNGPRMAERVRDAIQNTLNVER